MTRYKRLWKCGACGEDYIIDVEKRTGKCGCGTIKIYPPNKEMLLMNFELID